MDNIAYCADCMTALREFPDKHFDLCVADPPYGLNITGRHRKRERERENVLVGGARPFGGMRRLREGPPDPFCNRKAGGTSGPSEVLKIPPKFYPVFDDSSPPDADVFRELARVSKKLIIWGGNFFLDHLGPASCMIVWDKKRRGMD